MLIKILEGDIWILPNTNRQFIAISVKSLFYG